MPGQHALGKVRVQAKRTGHAQHVGVATGQRCLHAGQRAKATSHHDGHARHGLDGLGVFQKHRFAIARAVAHFALGQRLEKLQLLVGATRHLQQINARIVEPLHHLHTLIQRETALDEIRRIELDGNGVLRPHLGTHRTHHLQEQACTVGKQATPLVLALIGAGRQELRQQVAVRSVDLHPVQPGLLHQRGRGDKALDHILNVGLGGGARFAKVGNRVQLHGRRRQRCQVDQPRALAPRVADLCPQLAATVVRSLRPGAQLRQPGRVFHHHVASALQVAPIHHDVAGQQDRGTAARPGGVEPLVGDGRMVVCVSQTFGHGRFAQAVGNGVAAGQREGLFNQGRTPKWRM